MPPTAPVLVAAAAGPSDGELTIASTGKDAQEAAWMKIVEDAQVDLVVLARYMQVLSPATAVKLAGRCINICRSMKLFYSRLRSRRCGERHLGIAFPERSIRSRIHRYFL